MTQTADHPGVIAPPPLIFLGLLGAGWGLGRLLEAPEMPLQPLTRYALGSAAVVLGLGLTVWSTGVFRRRKTAVEPWKPSTALVVEGPYRFSRNPIYVGFALAYVGLATVLASWVALAFLAACLLIIERGVIAREERYLAQKFGADYIAYQRRVRRWL
jgi:protein-S-isoprenylcysteine O-methyltransferase Ste14